MIKVACEACNAPYELDPRRIPDKGMKMRCPKCGTSFMVNKQGAAPALTAPAEAHRDARTIVDVPQVTPPLDQPLASATGTMIGHRGAGTSSSSDSEADAAPATPAAAWKTAIGLAPPPPAGPEGTPIQPAPVAAPASLKPPARAAIAPPFTPHGAAGGKAAPVGGKGASVKGAFSATLLGSAAKASREESADLPALRQEPAGEPGAYMPGVYMPSDIPPAPDVRADSSDLSVSHMRIEDLPAPKREVDLRAPLPSDAEARRMHATLPERALESAPPAIPAPAVVASSATPAFEFGDLDLPAPKPRPAAKFGDLDLPKAKPQKPKPDLQAPKWGGDPDSLPREAAPQSPAASSSTSFSDLPAVKKAPGPAPQRAPAQSYGDLPAVKSPPGSAPRRAAAEGFGDLPTLMNHPAPDLPVPAPRKGREAVPIVADLPVVKDLSARAASREMPAGGGVIDLPVIKHASDLTDGLSELPVPKPEADLLAPRPASGGFGDLDLPVRKADLEFGALDLPAPTDNLPVARDDSRPFGDFDFGQSAPLTTPSSRPRPGAKGGVGHSELPLPKVASGAGRDADADEASFLDLGLEEDGNSAMPPSLMDNDESSFGDLELDAGPAVKAPARRLPGASSTGSRPRRTPSEDFEEVEPEEEMALGQSEGHDESFGEAQFADGAEQTGDEEMEFGISGDEAGKELSLPPEVLRRQRGKEFEARQQAIGRRTLVIVLRLAAVLVVLVALGGSLAFTEYGVFGVYYWERWLPEAGDPQFARAAIEKAERIAATDTYADVKRALRELGDARRKAGLNRELLSRSLLHESLFMVRFGDAVDSAAHAAAVLKRLQERSFRAPGMDLARAADAARHKQWRDAEAFLAKARADTPNDVYAELLAGEIALAQGKPDLADKAFGKALKLGGGARAQWGLGRLAAQRGDAEAEPLAVQETLKLSPQHIEARIAEARISWTQGKEERALHLLRVALGLDPTEDDQVLWGSKSARATAYGLLGYVHESRGRLHLAREAYQQALSADPYRVEALLGSGRVMLRERRYGDAQARFESALSAATKSSDNPVVLSGRRADAEAKLGIGRSLLSLQRGPQAKSQLAALSGVLPNDPEVILALGEAEQLLGNIAGAEADFRKSMELAPRRFDGYLALSQLFFKQGNAGKASEVLNDAAAHVEETAEMRRMLGQSELARGRLGSAVHEFQRALELEPQDTAAMFGLAIALRKQGDLERASGVLDEIERRDPAYGGLPEQKGLLLEARGEFARAAIAYRTALDKDPGDTALLLRYGAALVSAGNLDLAEQTLAKVVRDMPNSAEAEYFIGRIAFARGRTPDALTHFDRSVSLEPARGEYSLYVARASFEMGNLGRALEAAQTAIGLDPGLGDAYWVRAMVKLRTGSVKDSLSDLNKALRLNPARTEAYVVQGECYAQLRQLSEAIRSYRTALAREPTRGAWWFTLARLQADSGGRAEADVSLRKAIELGEGVDPIPHWLPDAYSLTGENADGRGDRTTAIRMYKKYLRVAPSGAIDRAEIERKLKKWDVQLEEEP